MVPEPACIARFASDLDVLAPAGSRLGIAVSGGPDSLALLLLAAAARPGLIEAATVDHGLRDGSREEALAVATVSAELGVPHAVLTAQWADKPDAAIQERARVERYHLLGGWAKDRGLHAIVTGHHADDQAETLLMRLNRGAGVRGLAGMRGRSTVPGSSLPLLRPLLSWRRCELDRICKDAGVEPTVDPSNAEARFERVRVRQALGDSNWLDSAALSASAGHLAAADEALDWAVEQEWRRGVSEDGQQLSYRPADAPAEIIRRLVARAINTLATEGAAEPLRGRELDPLLSTLSSGGRGTLRGVLCAGGAKWRFSVAPPRKR